VDCLYLVRNGVPLDVAFSLPEDDRLAWIVAIGSLDGLAFDWHSRAWVDT